MVISKKVKANQSGKKGYCDIILAVVRSLRLFDGPKLKLELKLNRITEKAGFSMRKKTMIFTMNPFVK